MFTTITRVELDIIATYVQKETVRRTTGLKVFHANDTAVKICRVDKRITRNTGDRMAHNVVGTTRKKLESRASSLLQKQAADSADRISEVGRLPAAVSLVFRQKVECNVTSARRRRHAIYPSIL